MESRGTESRKGRQGSPPKGRGHKAALGSGEVTISSTGSLILPKELVAGVLKLKAGQRLTLLKRWKKLILQL